MKKLLLGTAAAVALAAPAQAADLPVKAPPVVAAVLYNWSGFYIGGNAGYGWGRNQTATFTPNDANAFAGTCGGAFGGTCALPANYRTNGPIAGVQAGYNHQFHREWVLGLEVDFQWSGIDGSGTSPPFRLGTGAAGPPSTFHVREEIQAFGTVRARLGWLVRDYMLAYATGGLAYGRVVRHAVLDSVAGTNLQGGGIGYLCVAGPACFVGSSSRTTASWTAGGGIEYAFSRNWSFKGEYLYVNLRGDSVQAVATAAPLGTTPSSFTVSYGNPSVQVARFGINYKFGDAVVARY